MTKRIRLILFIGIPAAMAVLAILTVLFLKVNGLPPFPAKRDPRIIDNLKVGKYYLLRDYGLDQKCYIEVFDDNTLQFVGIDHREDATDNDPRHYNWNEPTPYQMYDFTPFVGIAVYGCEIYGDEKDDISYNMGITYTDENTLESTLPMEEFEDVVNFYRLANDPDNFMYNPNTLTAHFIFSE